MANFKCVIAYDGSCYHGFQRQTNAYTVQQAIEETIEKILKEKCIIYGCSRTDTGVHANEYCFNFSHTRDITPNGMQRALNGQLPDDISVTFCEEVEQDFHARYNTTAKEYIYLIHNAQVKNPFLRNRAFRYFKKIDVEKLQQAGQNYVGTHDFKAFSAAACDKVNTTRTIEYFKVERLENDIIKMTVKGDGFLYNMVRIMVGTLLFVNEGKIKPEEIPAIIEKKDRKLAGRTAPAEGLYLNKVFY